jgi:hypothetical protein
MGCELAGVIKTLRVWRPKYVVLYYWLVETKKKNRSNASGTRLYFHGRRAEPLPKLRKSSPKSVTKRRKKSPSHPIPSQVQLRVHIVVHQVRHHLQTAPVRIIKQQALRHHRLRVQVRARPRKRTKSRLRTLRQHVKIVAERNLHEKNSHVR